MFAIIKLSGKQYRVEQNQVIKTEKVPHEEGATFTVSDVLLTHDGKTVIGQPMVAGAGVELKVIKHGMGRKVRVFKMKAKKRYKRLYGHRQPFSKVEVVKITA